MPNQNAAKQINAVFNISIQLTLLLVLLMLCNSVFASGFYYESNRAYRTDSIVETCLMEVGKDNYTFFKLYEADVTGNMYECHCLSNPGNACGYVKRMCPEEYGYKVYRGPGSCGPDEYYIQPEIIPEMCGAEPRGLGNPIDPRAENKFQIETDYSDSTPMPLRMTRYYNSTGSGTGMSPLGMNWRHNYSTNIDSPYYTSIDDPKIPGPKSGIFTSPELACVNGWNEIKNRAYKGGYKNATAVFEDYLCKVQVGGATQTTFNVKGKNSVQIKIEGKNETIKNISRPNGTVYTFRNYPEGWKPTIDKDIKLELFSDETWQFTNTNGTKEIFDSAGKLIAKTSLTGLTQTLHYDASGRLDYVEDDNANRLTFAYDAESRVSSVTLPDATQIGYEYAANNNLTKVIYQDDTPEDLSDNPAKEYLYENATYPYSLTGITNEKGIRYSTFGYDDKGRATLTEHQNGAGKYEFVYNEDGTTTITNALGKVTTYSYTAINGQVKVESVEGHPTQMCGATNRNYTYNTNGFIETKTDWNGNVTAYTRDEMGRIEVKTTAVGTAEAKTTAYEYHPTLKLKTKIEQFAGEGVLTPIIKTTDIVYFGDEAGEEYWSGLVKSRTTTDPQTAESRTTSYTYYGEGEIGARQLKTVDGPRTDVQDITTYTYDEKGNLKTTVNALGHHTEINEHDGAGRPTALTDQNMIETVLTYTARGWLSISRRNGGDTQYIYDNVGNVAKIIAPDGSTIEYTYDDANRLTDITDKHGNTIHYELNAMGGITEQQIKDPQGTLTMIRSTVRDELNRIKHSIGANVEEDIETNYDDNGNVDNSVDAYQRVTDNSFDALNRVTETQDTAGGTTISRYDQFGNVNEIQDPRGLITKYNYNALGDLKELDSPDTGSTIYTHDSAGNITSQTDARGITVSYSYDALNRLTDVTYPDSSENIHYGYDSRLDANFGVGKLTSITDSSGTTSYYYFGNGLVSEETRALNTGTGTTTYTFGYQYNLADKLTHITYPSGMVVEYVRDDAGKITAVTANRDGQITTLANNLQYLPFGPQTNLQFGNGYNQSNDYNLNYQLQSINTNSVLDLDYTFDHMGNIDAIQNMLDSMYDQAFTLDNLYRIDTAAGEYGVVDYDLDATGNRVAITEDGMQIGYTVDPNSNRITAMGDITFGYDATGNTTSKATPEANWIYGYNQNGRLTSVEKDGQTVAQYSYNALGQRTQKTTEQGTTTQLFNSSAQLLVESTQELSKEYIYLGGQVLANYTAEIQQPTPPGACPGTTVTNSQHEAAGRAYTTSEITGQTCFGTFCWGGTTTTTWFVQGSGENLGTSGTTSTTLYENGSNNWQTTDPGTCVPTGPCQSITGTNQQHTDNSRAYTSTEMVGQTCWGTWCYGGTEQTVYKAQGSNDDLGADANTQNTLYQDPNGSFFLIDPETCPLELEDPNYVGFAYFHNDHLGTPRVVTDANGDEMWKGDYNPFGKVKETLAEGISYQQDIRFPGQVSDRETGLYYNYHRYYDFNLGRYVTSDPIGLGGGINTYAYVSGNPVMLIDPNGLSGLAALPRFAQGVYGLLAGGGAAATCAATNCFNPLPGLFDDLPPPGMLADKYRKDDATKDEAKPDCPPVSKEKENECTACQPYPAGVPFNIKMHFDSHSEMPGKGSHGCEALTGSPIHWHYDVMRQNPNTCQCFLSEHEFGGCGMGPLGH